LLINAHFDFLKDTHPISIYYRGPPTRYLASFTKKSYYAAALSFISVLLYGTYIDKKIFNNFIFLPLLFTFQSVGSSGTSHNTYSTVPGMINGWGQTMGK
jgi:hypothetical protein